MSERAAKQALATASKKRKSSKAPKASADGTPVAPGGGSGKTSYAASHATAQKRIKKSLKIENNVSDDAKSAIGRCLDEAAAAVVERFVLLHGPSGGAATGGEDASWPLLSAQFALTAIFSLIEQDKEAHDEVVDTVNNGLDTYYGVAPVAAAE